MPPPRSRARSNNGAVSSSQADAKESSSGDASVIASSETDCRARLQLAEEIFGVVVLLASEWVEVGSGLAEVSLRADAWGQRLMVAVLGEVRPLWMGR